MTRRPPHPLDADERALAAMLPRAHGRTEPGPELDARILAAARAATEPARAKPATRRRSWIAPTAVAASLMLAVGLAWQLRPPQPLRAPAPAAEAAAASDAGAEELAMRVFEAPPEPVADAVQAARPLPLPMATIPPPAEPPAPAKVASVPAPPAAAIAKPEAAAGVAVPPPPPAPPAPVILQSPPVSAPPPAPQATEYSRMAAPASAKSAQAGAAAAREQRAPVAGNAAVAQERDEAQRAADATTLDTVTAFPVEAAEAEQPDDEVPPATADSPDVRDAWLRRIGELLKQGKAEEAKASLDEFRRRYPKATIPPELRKLQP